jgi:ATP adenylyltransferase/5',5'''-P-1,P-4-tetraphosphate phosphorylase II
MHQKFIDQSILTRYGANNDYASQTKALLVQQKSAWEQLAAGYRSLNTVEGKTFGFDGFDIKVQFNPGRITSSSARVDPKSIKERPCFLCAENLPADQRGIRYRDDYIILCNPFPIFPEHFTIPHVRHLPQRITGEVFSTMLEISRDLGKYYTVFYNGPRCGASAPDHLHFQAGTRGFMILENEISSLKEKYGQEILKRDNITITALDDTLRRYITVESTGKDLITNAFYRFYEAYASLTADDEEPMMNILSLYNPDDTDWRVIIFPREKHRPSFYFAEGDENILLSPAAVDFGGVLITPLEKDFRKITRGVIVRMFEEVSFGKEKFKQLFGSLKVSK